MGGLMIIWFCSPVPVSVLMKPALMRRLSSGSLFCRAEE
jgi:hypothetical protein